MLGSSERCGGSSEATTDPADGSAEGELGGSVGRSVVDEGDAIVGPIGDDGAVCPWVAAAGMDGLALGCGEATGPGGSRLTDTHALTAMPAARTTARLVARVAARTTGSNVIGAS